MSSTSLAASAVSASDSKEPGCAPSRSARSRRTPAPSSPSIGLVCPATTMCGPSPLSALEQMELFPMSSAAASPARTSAPPELAKALMASDQAYGSSTCELLATWDPKSRSWKTQQRCFIEGWTAFSAGWPRSGMTQNGIAYALPPLEPHSKETDFIFLPRPTKSMGKRGWGFADTTLSQGRYSARITAIAKVYGWNPPVDLLEWAMGFPIMWTAGVEPSGSETLSSPKSRKSSVKP